MTETNIASRTVDGVAIPAPGTFALDVAHTRVGFVAKHLMVSKVRGQFTDFVGSITIADNPLESSAEATIQLSSVTTGQAQRDDHLRSSDFFEIDNHPTMTWVSKSITSHGDGKFTVVGDLTIKSVTREVPLKVELEGIGFNPLAGAEVLAFTAKGEIDREDFGITWNVALETGGVMVSKKITIEIEGEGIRQS